MIQPFRLLGSLRVAVTLLVSIAGVLAWGTLYETRYGTAAVQRFVYQAGWFQGILGFLAVNLATAAFLRFPWRRKHLPFLLAHLGIILILAGGILGGRLGVEGQLIIPEGESNGTLQLDRNVLVIHQPNPGIHAEFLTRFETTAWDHAPHALFEVPLEEGPLQVVVDRYYPDAERREEILDGGERENPAAHILLSHEGHEDDIWLLARDRDRFGARWGEAHVLFLEPESKKELKSLPPDSIILVREPFAAVRPEPVEGRTLVVRQAHHERVQPKGSARSEYGDLSVILTDSSGKRKDLRPIKAGAWYVHPGLGYRFQVSGYYPNARLEESYDSRGDEVRAEALHLVARQGERTVQSWLRLRETVGLPFGKHPVLVEYRPASRELPFSVKLLDFRKIDYPGTETAAAFESDVELSDPERGITMKKKISMNNPLKHRGYSLFQSSYVPGPVETTVLSVRKDPGVPLVYAGFLIVLSGVTLLFTSRARTTP